MLCLTGLPLIFRDEIDDLLFDSLPVLNSSEGSSSARLDDIVAFGRQKYPGYYIRTLVWDDEQPNVIKLSIVPSPEAPSAAVRRMAFDARTGQFLGEPQVRRGFTSLATGIHREMLLGLSGQLFLGFMGLLFCIATVSGIVIYGPFMRRLEFGKIRSSKSSRIKWLDIHNLLGITTIIWMLVVGVTGVMNSIASPLFTKWRTQVLDELLLPYKGRPMITTFSSVDGAVAAARDAFPRMGPESVIFPNSRFGSPRHYLIWMKGSSPLTARMFAPALVDAETGTLSQAQELPLYLKAMQLSRPLHFGDYGGMSLKIIWAVLDIIAIVILGSGLYIWISGRSTIMRSLSSKDI